MPLARQQQVDVLPIDWPTVWPTYRPMERQLHMWSKVACKYFAPWMFYISLPSQLRKYFAARLEECSSCKKKTKKQWGTESGKEFGANAMEGQEKEGAFWESNDNKNNNHYHRHHPRACHMRKCFASTYNEIKNIVFLYRDWGFNIFAL